MEEKRAEVNKKMFYKSGLLNPVPLHLTPDHTINTEYPGRKLGGKESQPKNKKSMRKQNNR